MALELLNTLYVTLDNVYLHLQNETIRVEQEGKLLKSIPLHHLGCIVITGNVLMSPALLARCADDGRNVVWLDMQGRFRARLEGRTTGNVLLRRQQYATCDNPTPCLALARAFVAGKLHNLRFVLRRSERDSSHTSTRQALRNASEAVATLITTLPQADHLDAVRGIEGAASQVYFSVFPQMIRSQKEHFAFDGRNRRPPRDPMNALLSFLYALLLTDCIGALESVGLDPQVGFLHAIRPGKPALALDLMEEFRPVVDRLALTLVNRQQIRPQHFEHRPPEAVLLNDEGRKIVLVAYQERKQEQVHHPHLKQPIPMGLVPLVQARLLARAIRQDVPHYPPFVLS